MARVNILQRVKTSKGWSNVPLKRTPKGGIRWPPGGRYFIEWREDGRRLRQSAGDTPSEALEAQKRKGFQLDATETGFEITDVRNRESQQLLVRAVDDFLRDIETFRKPLTYQKYTYILQLFCEHVAPKSGVLIVLALGLTYKRRGWTAAREPSADEYLVYASLVRRGSGWLQSCAQPRCC